MLVLKATARLVGAVLMIAVALLGLGVALYCLDRLVAIGSARPDRLLHLPAVRDTVGSFLNRLGASGPTAGIALLCGVGAVITGGLLLLGIFGSGRQRDALLSHTDEGDLAISSRALRSMVRTLAVRVDGITAVRHLKLSLRRQGRGGRLRLTVLTNGIADPGEVRRSVAAAVQPLAEPLDLRTRVSPRPGGPRQRVQ